MTPVSIDIFDHLPEPFVEAAADIYLTALADKLVPIYGDDSRARRALADGFNRASCLVALVDGQLAGILGIQTAAAGFMDVTPAVLRPHYGWPGTIWRMALLLLLHHTPLEGEVYVDGLAVSPALRGQGIGSRLMAALERWAGDHGLSAIRLEVIDTNPGAERLYLRLGFATVSRQRVWPLGSLFGFQGSQVMVKVLDPEHPPGWRPDDPPPDGKSSPP